MPTILHLKQAQTATEGLMTAVRHGLMGLDSLPRMIHRVLTEGYWKERVLMTGDRVTNACFRDYITKPPHEGIGADPEKIRQLLGRSPRILEMFDRAMRGPGEADTSEQHRAVRTGTRGNSTAYAIYRLKRVRPDLAMRVQSGEISAYRALKEAGFRRSKTAMDICLDVIPTLTERERKYLLQVLKRGHP